MYTLKNAFLLLSFTDEQLWQRWSAFRQKESDPDQLLIDLIVSLLDETWSEEDKSRLLDAPTSSEMASVLFDIAPKKSGEKVKMMSYFENRDPTLYSGLGLPSYLPASTGEFRITYCVDIW